MAHGYFLCLCVLAFLKYFRLAINSIAYWSYKPVPLSDDPLFSPHDVTVVVPSLNGDTEELRETLRSVLDNGPHEVVLVTLDANVEKAERMAASINPKKIRVLSIPKANKRHQMCRALPSVTTEITVFADDDVIWPSTVLPWILAPFKDPKMGGVCTNQRLRREASPNLWNFLGAAYLIRRNWDCTACCFIDGGLPCLSGRTVAYRSLILQDAGFQHSFKNETWKACGLNADDDNFLTRWMVTHGWRTWIQFHRDCEVQTTLEDNVKYLKQCNRWARSNWRSNLTTLFCERIVWRRHLWSVFAVFQTTLTSWSLPADALMLALVWQSTASYAPSTRHIARGLWFLWVVLLSRLVKYIEHFCRHPEDLKYLAVIPAFGYFHSCVIKPYAMATMHVTTWGSREGADANDSSRMVRLPGYDDEINNTLADVGYEDMYADESTPILPKYHGSPVDDAPKYQLPGYAPSRDSSLAYSTF